MTSTDHHQSSSKRSEDINIPEPVYEKRLLNPIERISEVLFGLIMALTFTCSISVAQSDRTEIRDLLIAAIGCNIAWGLVDAVMYILTGLAEKGRGKSILHFIRRSSNMQKAREFIADALPPVVASVIKTEDLEQIRKSLNRIPESSLKIRLTLNDFKQALGIFLLVFFSTFPVAIPFVFIHDAQVALRVSNLVAILLMFLCGWLLGRYGGYKKWVMGLTMTILGVVLVLITIALGG